MSDEYWYITYPFCQKGIGSLHSRRRAILGLVSHAFSCKENFGKRDWWELWEEIENMDFLVKENKEVKGMQKLVEMEETETDLVDLLGVPSVSLVLGKRGSGKQLSATGFSKRPGTAISLHTL